MREWVPARYTPLVEFAPLDNESETGFAFDAEDIFVALQGEFDHQYPFEWIGETAAKMEIEGPWGLPEKYGPYDSDVDAEPPTAGPEDNSQRDDLSVEHEDYSDRL